MPNSVIVLGTQWGDEGKGKIADLLASRAETVVRSQGGNNAGHTLVAGTRKFVVRLVPSGILRPDSLCLIGSGVVVNPGALFEEMEELTRGGVPNVAGRLKLSGACALLLPIHPAIGTTGRGIGPCYEDKVARRGLRLGDLRDLDAFSDRLRALLDYRNFLLREYYHAPEVSYETVTAAVLPRREQLLGMLADVPALLQRERRAGRKILFEGAQGTFLDIDAGTYPYVTSSNTVAGGCVTGSGAGPRDVDYILGIGKVYVTRVGGGPFPTELNDALGEEIRARGHEYGAVTGRPRRTGWYDAVAMRRAVMLNSLSGLALMKLDVLDSLPEIKICTAYRYPDGTTQELPPAAAAEYAAVRPVYETLPGWQTSTVGVTRWEDLPPAAQRYIRRIEELAGVPAVVISTGPERDQTIMRRDPFGA